MTPNNELQSINSKVIKRVSEFITICTSATHSDHLHNEEKTEDDHLMVETHVKV